MKEKPRKSRPIRKNCYLKLTDDVKSHVVAAIVKQWDYIAYDSLNLAPNQFMTAQECRDIVCDYVDDEKFRKLKPEDQDICLEEAIPLDQSI